MNEGPEKNQRKGVLLNITGNGKGKTTSALGTAVRAMGWGWRVVIIQFVKGEMETGERQFFSAINHPVDFFSMGMGATWTADIEPEQHAEAAKLAWEKAAGYLNDPSVDLLVLDELNIALSHEWLGLDAVITALQKRPVAMHVIVTGRYAPEQLIAASDLVSEINEIKHPFRQGIHSQKGIEY